MSYIVQMGHPLLLWKLRGGNVVPSPNRTEVELCIDGLTLKLDSVGVEVIQFRRLHQGEHNQTPQENLFFLIIYLCGPSYAIFTYTYDDNAWLTSGNPGKQCFLSSTSYLMVYPT